MYAAVKHRTYEILESNREHDILSQCFQIFLIALIILNVVAVVLESIRTLLLQYYQIFLIFEIFSIAIFSVEYGLRLWTCTENPEYARPVMGRIRYAITPFAIIDLLAILPFFLPFTIPVDLRFLRIIRLMRIFRALKLVRYSNAFTFLSRAIKREKYTFAVIFLILTVLFLFASTLMFYAECEAQPEVFASIPHAMWWAVVTLTTVGYGDIYPITVQGKVLGAIIAVIGIGLFALPAGVIAAGFIEETRCTRRIENEISSVERLTVLERLVLLKEQGHLNEEEFAAEKKRILEK
jgi:voltage-gated potassium channel